MGFAFHQLRLRYSGTLILTDPIRLWETFTFLCYTIRNLAFFMFCNFSHHSSATLSKIKLQGKTPYLGLKYHEIT